MGEKTTKKSNKSAVNVLISYFEEKDLTWYTVDLAGFV